MTELQVASETAPLKRSGNYRPRLSQLLGHRGFFALCVLVLVGVSILRSAIATRLDGFTIDEAYHITAGVSYVRNGDFQINPEHPPLVKLWVGSFVSATGFNLSPIRKFTDKPDERDFTEHELFVHNDFESVQRRARSSMFALNGLLLIGLGFALRRALGPVVALGALTFLMIDPTVAANLPIVMTDLPVSLLSVTAVVLAIRAFQYWEWVDLVCCSVALGLALGAKHSAPIFFIVLMVCGSVCAFALPACRPRESRYMRLGKLFSVALGALFVLWGLYGFRYTETHASQDAFNRPLTDKIGDLRSPAKRAVLTDLARSHVVPRAYIWGFADTMRAGLESRALPPIFAFGRSYGKNGPRFFFPGMIALKLPVGLSILALIGLCLYLTRRLPRDWNLGLGLLLVALCIFLFVLSTGSTYGGIRHALPAVVLLSVFAGCAMCRMLSSRARALRAIAAVCIAAAAVSALPVMRPWEYFNELIGGTKNSYLYFNDEGVDVGQRTKELAAYYHQVLEPLGDKPFVEIFNNSTELNARGVNMQGHDKSVFEYLAGSPTIAADARFLNKTAFWNHEVLRNRVPSARFGNLMIFRGPCNCQALLAPGFFFAARGMIYSEKPDLVAAEQMLKMSVALDPSAYFVYIQLGNLYLRQGLRDRALQAYSDGSRHASFDPERKQALDDQIHRVSSQPFDKVAELRNPAME